MKNMFFMPQKIILCSLKGSLRNKNALLWKCIFFHFIFKILWMLKILSLKKMYHGFTKLNQKTWLP